MKLIEIRENGSKRVVTINEEPSKTDQSFAKQVNINNIMARYIKTGQLTHLRNQQGVYADMSEIKRSRNSCSTSRKSTTRLFSITIES